MSKLYACRFCGRPIVFRTLKKVGLTITDASQVKGRVVPIHLEGGCQLQLRF